MISRDVRLWCSKTISLKWTSKLSLLSHSINFRYNGNWLFVIVFWYLRIAVARINLTISNYMKAISAIERINIANAIYSAIYSSHTTERVQNNSRAAHTKLYGICAWYLLTMSGINYPEDGCVTHLAISPFSDAGHRPDVPEVRFLNLTSRRCVLLKKRELVQIARSFSIFCERPIIRVMTHNHHGH